MIKRPPAYTVGGRFLFVAVFAEHWYNSYAASYPNLATERG